MARFSILIGMVMLFMSSFSSGIADEVELIENGNFETDLDRGWKEDTTDGYGGIERDTDYDEDTDFEAFVFRKNDIPAGLPEGHIDLSQTIEIPGLDLWFSTDARIYARTLNDAGDSSRWVAASVTLLYLNDNEDTLGKTRIYRGSRYCTWEDSNTEHLIEVGDGWDSHEFNVRKEVEENLPGINPYLIEKIVLSLHSYSPDHHGC